MASSSDYQIRAVVNSTADPDATDTSQFSGTFGVWQDLSSDRSWSIQVDVNDPSGNYLKNVDFEIRNKHTLEIVSTTSGDFILNIDFNEPINPNGPFYSTSVPKFYWRIFQEDTVYWNDVAVFAGDFDGTTSIVSGGWKYFRDAFVNGGSAGGFYQVRRETTTENDTPSYPPIAPYYTASNTYWQDGPYGDSIWFNGTQVFSGTSTSLNNLTSKTIGEFTYIRGTVSTSNPGGVYYKVGRQMASTTPPPTTPPPSTPPPTTPPAPPGGMLQ